MLNEIEYMGMSIPAEFPSLLYHSLPTNIESAPAQLWKQANEYTDKQRQKQAGKQTYKQIYPQITLLWQTANKH